MMCYKYCCLLFHVVISGRDIMPKDADGTYIHDQCALSIVVFLSPVMLRMCLLVVELIQGGIQGLEI